VPVHRRRLAIAVGRRKAGRSPQFGDDLDQPRLFLDPGAGSHRSVGWCETKPHEERAALQAACITSPAASSSEARFTQSTYRSFTFHAALADCLVTRGSALGMPKPTAGIAADRWIRRILVERNAMGVATLILLYADLAAADLKSARTVYVVLEVISIYSCTPFSSSAIQP